MVIGKYEEMIKIRLNINVCFFSLAKIASLSLNAHHLALNIILSPDHSVIRLQKQYC